MCGINGVIYTDKIDPNQLKSDIAIMNDLIIHRGPDDDGIYYHTSKDCSLAMGMRRLSIIDLNSGKQPLYSKDNQTVIVFNGEIYNYKKLRTELEIAGTQFLTKSDTEVILKLYELEGVNSFHKLDGMFAFSIYDKIKNKVFIARDFFGEKPLYYSNSKTKFIWSSELKSLIKTLKIKPAINKIGLNLFFRLTYIPSPYTIYEGIHKLMPYHFLEYDVETKILSDHKIEHIKTKSEEKKETFDNAKSKVKELVISSVDSRSVSDVPVGTFLSGGVDSSIVSLCLSKITNQRINTFSIGFEQKVYDETDKARTVAKLINSDHHEFVLNEKDLEKDVHKIISNFDEPFADSSMFPSFLVANKTSDYVKVALTGDGGDEVFGGYNKYHMGSLNQKYTRFVPQVVHTKFRDVMNSFANNKKDYRGKRFAVKKFLNSINYTKNYYWDIISLGYTSNTLNDYLLYNHLELDPFLYYKNYTGIASPNNLTEFRKIDKHISLEGDMLVKVDRTSMLSSLECRAPFLNKQLWEYTNSLPEDYLMKGWSKKHILKEAFKEEFPEGFLNKPKSGFGIPIGDWLRGSLKSELLSYTNKSFLKAQEIFQIEKIHELVNNHLNGKDHTFKVWTYFCFQKWYTTNYKNL